MIPRLRGELCQCRKERKIRRNLPSTTSLNKKGVSLRFIIKGFKGEHFGVDSFHPCGGRESPPGIGTTTKGEKKVSDEWAFYLKAYLEGGDR